MRTEEPEKMVQQFLKNDQSLGGKHWKNHFEKNVYLIKNYMFLIGYDTQT